MNLYGDSYEGTWLVMPPADDHDGFGPFPNRDEAAAFMRKVRIGDNGYAVNLTDYPNWFNVRRRLP